MKVKEVLIRALGFIGRSDVASALSCGEALEGEIKETAETLLYCYNAVEDELARFYFPVVIQETLRNSRGVYEFSMFSRVPLKIICVRSNGKEIAYTQISSGISAGASEITVEYRCVPAKKELSDSCEFSGGAVTEKMLATGAAAEFSLINGDVSGAEFFEGLYRREIDFARRAVSAPTGFPPRRWV
ncbi:MAG: hypothetical protein K2L42_03530 [Clostridia bacterium]|nr:hypothetical protein [Clostridia bacterium]